MLNVTATDADEGEEDKRVTYNIDNFSQTKFKIEELTGLITLKKSLDFELKKDYQITVTASDHGDPQLSTTTTVNVTVIDVNDTPPEIKPVSLQ